MFQTVQKVLKKVTAIEALSLGGRTTAGSQAIRKMTAVGVQAATLGKREAAIGPVVAANGQLSVDVW